MKKVLAKLSRSELGYLQSADFLSHAQLQCLQHDAQWHTEMEATLALPATAAEEFREAFTKQLAKVGFDQAYEPTAEGRLLEDLIDRFHSEYSA